MSCTSPLVSVIIPCYNGERFLKETLDSVLRQTYRNLEVILVDDGSTDSTPDIVQGIADGRLAYVRQPNSGPAAARNAGFFRSKGCFLAFMDSDDVWHPQMLERCVDVLSHSSDDYGAVTTDFRYIDDQGHALQRDSGWRPWRGNVFLRLLQEIAFCGPAIVWRRECFERIGGFDLRPELNDDWINWLRIAREGYLFEAVSDKLVSVRRHEQNITKTQAQRTILWELHALDVITAESDLPPELVGRAYARVRFKAAQQAIADGDDEGAQDWFCSAIQADHRLLECDSTYYALAFGRLFPSSDTPPKVDLVVGEHRLRAMLDALRSLNQLEGAGRSWREQAMSRALYCLSRIAYSDGASQRARSLIIQALLAHPGIILHPHVPVWLARIAAGPQLVSVARTVLIQLRGQ